MTRYTATPPKDRLAGRVAIVTGGARGMGEGEVRRLVAEGADVVITDVLDTEGEALAAELSPHAVYVHLDVTDEGDWQAAVKAAQEAFGPVTILVNNAGIIGAGPVDTMDAAEFRRVVDVNLTGTFLGIKAIAPQMAEAGGGAIVNICSAAGLVPMAGLSAYCASKWGQRGLTKVAAMDLGRHSIRVNSIHPGAVRTPMLGDAGDDVVLGQPIERIGEPEEIGAAVAFLASDDAQDITGAELAVDGGMALGRMNVD